MVIIKDAALVALKFMLDVHPELGPDPSQVRMALITENIEEAKADPRYPSNEEIEEYNRKYNLALLEEMKKNVTYEEYLAWGNDLGEARPCDFRGGQCELFCEKFTECKGD